MAGQQVPARQRLTGLLLVASLCGAIVPALLSAPGVAAASPGAGGAHTAGPAVTVSPLPGSRTAPPGTQISIVGVPMSRIGTVTVTGSKSGVHTGQLEAYSQGDGASFVMSNAFTPGEIVKVQTGLDISNGRNGGWQFKVAQPAQLPPPPPPAVTKAVKAPKPSAERPADSYYVSDPTLNPPTLTVDVRNHGLAPGYVFLSLAHLNTGSSNQGIEIVDNAGHPVWFDQIPKALDFKVQQYLGQPVLTWWRGKVVNGTGYGHVEIMNSSYQKVALITGGNGLQADLHECVLESNGAAIITGYQPVYWNLSAEGGPTNAIVLDSVVLEVDVKTGLVRYEWDSLDHVPVTQSQVAYTSGQPYDYFHINSIQPNGARFLISGRNVSQIYDIKRSTGRVLWQLGGKNSTFAMGAGSEFAWQHDAELHSNGTVSLFDDEGFPEVNPPSRGLVLQLNTSDWTATVLQQYVRSPSVEANSQGNTEELPNGNAFVGWGSVGDESEFSSTGTELFDLELPAGDSSYRAFRFPWTGTPVTPPDLVVQTTSDPASDEAYVSWNGATTVAKWVVLGGSSSSNLSPLVTTARRGFQTHAAVPAEADYEVQAMNSAGKVIGTSGVVTPTSPG